MLEKHSVAIRFKYCETYLPDNPVIDLLALIYIDAVETIIYLSIFPFNQELLAYIEALPDDLGSIKQFAVQNHFPVLDVSAPWELIPAIIPKPWGQEIWFTGIEARGQARVRGEGGDIPLPWVLALFPQSHRPLILLKILDPLPDEVYGDLYFELHEEKQEVYVVTSVDQQAWPNGKGAIQLGFAPEKRREYKNNDEFKAAYLQSVQCYEQVRRALDKKLDDLRLSGDAGFELFSHAEQLKRWINTLSQSIETKGLIQLERQLRCSMNEFINRVPLSVGDTLAIPRRVPHALQHGVRVVEFQTPVYERKILSFAQKVLTQNHWDTESALAIADMDHSLNMSPELLVNSEQAKVEQIVSFDDFQVQRIHLNSCSYCEAPSDYSLVMPITGDVHLVWGDHSKKINEGEVVLVPNFMQGAYRFITGEPCLFLYASPRVLITTGK